MNTKYSWKHRDRRQRAWVYDDNGGGRMVLSTSYASLGDFYRFLDECDRYDLMDWSNLTDTKRADIYEADNIRVYGGEFHAGFWECDRSGTVEFRGAEFGLINREGVFYPFGCAFEPYYPLHMEVLDNVYEADTGHLSFPEATAVTSAEIVPF